MNLVPIRVLIVDDEAPARKRLARMLAAHPEIKLVGEAANGVAALESQRELLPDLIFLDIEMPEMNGIDVARNLQPDGPPIIFVTAYDEYALKAFEANAMDYLLKPVETARLEVAIERAKKLISGKSQALRPEFFKTMNSEARPKRLAIRSGAKFVVFDPQQISAILAKDHYSAFIVNGRELLSDDPLDLVEARLDGAVFVRVHRSSIINLNYLAELEREGDRKFTAVLSDSAKTRVAVSREQLPLLKKTLGIE
jgi:DNA-binding LytR/AlgR family response regulator